MEEIAPEEMEICLAVLQRLADRPILVSRSERLKGLIAKIFKQSRREEDRLERQKRETNDRAIQATTAMVRIQRDALPAAAALPAPGAQAYRTLNEPENCYICKKDFTEVHFFYHLLCPECAEHNYRMRDLHADLSGRTALVTGGRVKIGYQLVLRLLQDGARVIVTTRFPHSAARRFAEESDFERWGDRLCIYGLDLRNIPAVEWFAHYLMQTEPALDIVVHNAAQTIRRPQGFYRELEAQEECPETALNARMRSLVRHAGPSVRSIGPARNSLTAMLSEGDALPVHDLLDNEERADSRTVNSWLLRLDEVSTAEMVEVQLVNSFAPFILNSRLKPLMMRSPFARRFIVNVSAMEGQFRRHKTVFHPHTNMAKAALNMMTRTSGDDYARDRIYMTSVDTGWVTDENPTPKRTRRQEDDGFFAPLDIVDGMVRIYHPIAEGINLPQTPHFGLFLKDFVSCPW